MANSIKASINNNPPNGKSAVTSILSINEMNYQPRISNHEAIIPEYLTESTISSSKENQEGNASGSKLTLIAALRNALINKDTDSFLFCLEQTDNVLIENTVKGMDGNTIKMVIEKLIDLFQRSKIHNLNIVPWMSQIIKCHYFIILSMNSDVIQNLNKIKALIDNYTQNYSKLVQLKKKLDIVNIQSSKMEENTSINSKGKIEPLLLYEESDDEEEKEKNKKKKAALSKNGIELYKEEYDGDDLNNQMDIDYDNKEDEDDYFDIANEDEDEDKSDNDGKKLISKRKNKEQKDEDEEIDSDA